MQNQKKLHGHHKKDFFNNLKKNKILITGVNGFVGIHTSILASKYEIDVLGIDLVDTFEKSNKIRSSLDKNHRINFVEINDFSTEFKKIFKIYCPDIIIHLAGYTNKNKNANSWESNIKNNSLVTVFLTKYLIDLPKQLRPIIIYAGTQMEYGNAVPPWTEETIPNPVNSYGYSKLLCSEILVSIIKSKIIRGCVIRFPIIYGPGQSQTMLIPNLIYHAIHNKILTLNNPNNFERLIFVTDVAEIIFKIAIFVKNKNKIPVLINSPASKPIKIENLAKKVTNKIKINNKNYKKSNTGSKNNNNYPDTSLADSMDLLNLTKLEEGLDNTINWYKSNLWFF